MVWHMAKAGKDLAVAGLVVEAIPFGSGFLTFPMSELTPVECVMAAFAREAIVWFLSGGSADRDCNLERVTLPRRFFETSVFLRRSARPH